MVPAMEGGRVRGDPQSGSRPRAVPSPVTTRPAAPRPAPFGPVSPAATPEEFERELTRLTLSGEGWPLILRRLAAHTGHAAWLFDVHGELLASSVAPATDPPTVRASDVAQVFGAERPVPLTMSDGRPARAASVRADR